ncbi:MAG: class I SAM-dependent methyltransferase [Nanoarchaeota archaeon]|nr:class I SAM-dependent methyltransferase [Nanoarchaeota archaeon]
MEKDFSLVADEILAQCKELYWHVPNNIKKEQIHVRSWNVPKSTAQFLYLMAFATKAKQILELGTSAGYSTIWLAKAAQENGGTVDTIEYFAPKCEVAQKHFKQAGVDEVITLHQDTILEVLKVWEKDIDFIFMDADRGNYDQYFFYLYPALKKGGIIVVDNAGNYRDRMVRFLKAAQEAPHQYSTFLDLDNGLFLFIK